MGGSTGRRVPLSWVVLAGIAAIGLAVGTVSGSGLKALLYLAILACPLLHLLGGHQHGSGRAHHAGDREGPDHVHASTGEDASAATPPQTSNGARGEARPA